MPLKIEPANRIAAPLVAAGVSKEVSSPDGPLAILRDINLAVASGEAVAILGPSGSGKTTLLALLAGLDDASRGEIRLFGETLGALDENRKAALRAGRVGFVFQDFNLLARLTAVENVRIALELAGSADAAARAEEAIAEVGLAARARHYPATLSGGEQQRVAIARAFAPRPQLLFADEPTGNLDSASGARVIELLFDLRAKQGSTLILATHDERLARRCGRRLHLDNGLLHEQEPVRTPGERD
ncbi:MAG TPA: ABC transporter ATP-binding protein [Gammaproteobacteria bacterium]|nr:ABC transporter ATP-binding protein [Gammaproteobacteria bacterium]